MTQFGEKKESIRLKKDKRDKSIKERKKGEEGRRKRGKEEKGKRKKGEREQKETKDIWVGNNPNVPSDFLCSEMSCYFYFLLCPSILLQISTVTIYLITGKTQSF